jgi:hypothetical protein
MIAERSRSAALERMSAVLACESGQGMTEFAIINFALFAGTAISYFAILPLIVNAYNTIIHGYYLVLGLPFP